MQMSFIIHEFRRSSMALSAFLNVNGYDYPCPRYGFQYVLSTPVNAGRNVNAAFIGQRVNRDL